MLNKAYLGLKREKSNVNLFQGFHIYDEKYKC